MPESNNRVPVSLRRIGKKADRVTGDVRGLKVRVTNVEDGQAGTHGRPDRVEMRPGCIGRRLDLVEAPH